MSKTLYVRGIRNSTHRKITTEADKRGTTAASIVEDAFEKWFKEQKDVPKKHIAVLYSNENSLQNFMLKVKEVLGNQWLHACFGPPTHFALKFLKKNGWSDVTINPISEARKKTANYTNRIISLRTKAAKKQPIASMGFLASYLSSAESPKKGNLVEKLYNEQRSAGIAFCPYDLSDVKEFSLDDILEMFDSHDKVLILKNNDILELDVTKSNLAKSLL